MHWSCKWEKPNTNKHTKTYIKESNNILLIKYIYHTRTCNWYKFILDQKKIDINLHYFIKKNIISPLTYDLYNFIFI